MAAFVCGLFDKKTCWANQSERNSGRLVNLINQLFFAVLISSVTSTLLFFVWWLLRGFFMTANAKLVYLTLRCICIMYLMPVGYMAVLITYRNGFKGQVRVWRMVFTRTREITDKLWIGALIWFVAVIGLISHYIFDRLRWRKKLADNIQEINPATIRIYRKVCSSLNLKEDMLKLSRNVEIDMPCVIGWFRQELILPERDYEDHELELIFFHELSHQKHKDLKFKAITVLVMMIHCFNLITLLLLRKINFWSECMADLSALEASGNLDYAKPYFDNIVRLIPDDKKKQVESAFVSTLCKSKKMIDGRVDFVKKYKAMKSSGRVVTAALALSFVLALGTTAYASGKTVADLHNAVYQDAEEFASVQGSDVKTVVADDGMIEYHGWIEYLDRDGLQIVTAPNADGAAFADEVHYNMDWYVESGIRYVSGEYYLTTNQIIYAAVAVTPGNKRFYLGIKSDHGTANYVKGRGTASHNFIISESGKYRIFIQNDTDVTLHATGYFAYENY